MLQIIVFFWLLMFCTLCFQFIEPLSQSSNIDRCLAMFIFLIGAPCFFLVNVLNSLLDCIFPEGWDNFQSISYDNLFLWSSLDMLENHFPCETGKKFNKKCTKEINEI